WALALALALAQALALALASPPAIRDHCDLVVCSRDMAATTATQAKQPGGPNTHMTSASRLRRGGALGDRESRLIQNCYGLCRCHCDYHCD
ncbi:hypothetical protein N9L68_08915, partial [bacterium]|nr:hypothetical protein [bacterium]